MFNPHVQGLLAQTRAQDARREAKRVMTRELRSQRRGRWTAQTQVSRVQLLAG
jgi:hypothetical protein